MAGSSDGTGAPEGAPYRDHAGRRLQGAVAPDRDHAGRPFKGAVTRRTIEVWTALGIACFGAIVSLESLTHDIGWNETGPGPGYFPFRIGLLLVAAAAVRAGQILRAGGSDPFATPEALRRSASVFWPTALLAAAMLPLGAYVPSIAYLTWMMRRHGGYAWRTALAFAVAVMAAFFILFEIWFRVPLAKGPFERAVGL